MSQIQHLGVVFFTASGYTISFKSCLHTRKKEKQKEKKIIPFRQNLLGSLRPFPELIQFFALGASLSYGKPPKSGRINKKSDSNERIEPGKIQICSQPPACCSGQAHWWLSSDVTKENIFQPITSNEQPLILWFSSLVWDKILIS